MRHCLRLTLPATWVACLHCISAWHGQKMTCLLHATACVHLHTRMPAHLPPSGVHSIMATSLSAYSLSFSPHCLSLLSLILTPSPFLYYLPLATLMPCICHPAHLLIWSILQEMTVWHCFSCLACSIPPLSPWHTFACHYPCFCAFTWDKQTPACMTLLVADIQCAMYTLTYICVCFLTFM